MHASEQTGPSSGERRPGREAEGEGEGTRGRVGRVPVAGLWWPVLSWVLATGPSPPRESRPRGVGGAGPRRPSRPSPVRSLCRHSHGPPGDSPRGPAAAPRPCKLTFPRGQHTSQWWDGQTVTCPCAAHSTQSAVRLHGVRGALLATAVAPSSSPLQGRKGLPNPNWILSITLITACDN